MLRAPSTLVAAAEDAYDPHCVSRFRRSPRTGPPSRARTREPWFRHPADVARLVANLVVLAALWASALVAPDLTRDLSLDLIDAVDRFGGPIAPAVVGLTQLLAILVPFAVTIWLVVRRRVALLGLFALSSLTAAIVMVLSSDRLRTGIPLSELGLDRVESWFVGRTFPSATYLAALVAVLVTASPWMRQRWRRAGWVLIALVTLARVLTATEVPLRVGVLVALGAAAGSLTLVVFGGPRRRVDPDTVAAALRSIGQPVRALSPISDHGGVPTFRAELVPATRAVAAGSIDGSRTRAFVKVLGRDERDTDLLLRSWRSLRVKGLGDDRPAGSPRRVAENEVLALAMARAAGVRVPEPLAVTRTEQEAAVVATEWLDGAALVTVDREVAAPDDVRDDDRDDGPDDETLVDLWSQVARLQRHRIAHRALHPSNVLVTRSHPSGTDGPAIVDFRRAALDASDEVLGADVAELLASLALVVGAERAVSTAAAGLDPEQLTRALPLLQPAVLSPSVRARVKRQPHLLDEVRTRAAVAAGVGEVEVVRVDRISVRGAVSLLGSIVLVGYVVNLVSNWSQTWDTIVSADTVLIAPILVLVFAGFAAGALSLLGAVTVGLPFVRTTQVMFAQSFLNRFTPANAGGMAMRMRYLQLHGLDATAAATSVGLTSIASGIVQGLLIVVFFVWGGTTDRLADFSLPDFTGIVLGLLVVGGAVGIVMISGWGRRTIVPWIRRTSGTIRTTLATLVADPGKMAQLFGGAALGKLTNIVAFWLSLEAFGVDMSFAKAGALFMIANTLGSAVPTPGGVGGIEAAMTAVLISFGVDHATAAAVVLFYRFFTFWLPTLPGYVMLRWVQARGVV